jgi:hypothetical protein
MNEFEYYDYDCLETGEFDGVTGVIQNEDGVFYI